MPISLPQAPSAMPLLDFGPQADVDVEHQIFLNAVPEAVAVMDIPDAAFQAGRNVATQVANVLAASGHGMITYSRGLNMGTQIAEDAGVAAL